MKFLSTFAYKTLLKFWSWERGDRVVAWRDLGIEDATLVNPYSLDIPEIHSSLEELESIKPLSSIRVLVREASVLLDRMDDLGDERLSAILPPKNDEVLTERDANSLGNRFLEFSRSELKNQEFCIALRLLLNCIRLGLKSEEHRRALADALAFSGYYFAAGKLYVLLAMDFEERKLFELAADCYQRAGLSWEASKNETRLNYCCEQGFFDSTSCFRRSKSLFGSSGLYDEASKCFVLERDTQMRWTWAHFRKLELLTMRWLWLYGESVFRAARSILMLWFWSAIGFFIFGIQHVQNGVNETVCFSGDLCSEPLLLLQHLGSALYFSAVTITTLGYGDFTPACNLSRLISMLEAGAGLCLFSMFLIALQRRFVGR